MISFTIPGEPMCKERPRVVNGRTYTPKRTKQAEEAIAWAYKAACANHQEQGDLSLTAVFCRSDKRRVDLDNLLKLLMDGLTKGGAWVDDSQIVHLNATLWRGELNPSTFVRIEAFGKRVASDLRAEMRRTP